MQREGFAIALGAKIRKVLEVGEARKNYKRITDYFNVLL